MRDPSGFEHRNLRINPYQECPSVEQLAYTRSQLSRPPGLLRAVVAYDQPARRPGPFSTAHDQGRARSEVYNSLGDAACDQALYRSEPPAANNNQAYAQLLGEPDDLFGGAAFSEVRLREGPPGAFIFSVWSSNSLLASSHS